MRTAYLAGICLSLLPCLSLAQSPEHALPPEVLLSCVTTGGKTLSLHYLAGDLPLFTYRFGPPDAPELTLSLPATEVAAFAPWPGVGRAITNGVTLEKAGYAYTVWTNFDRLAEDASPVSGGVTVTRHGQTLATFPCAQTPEPVISSPFGIEDAMAAAGLVFDTGRQRWVQD